MHLWAADHVRTNRTGNSLQGEPAGTGGARWTGVIGSWTGTLLTSAKKWLESAFRRMMRREHCTRQLLHSTPCTLYVQIHRSESRASSRSLQLLSCLWAPQDEGGPTGWLRALHSGGQLPDCSIAGLVCALLQLNGLDIKVPTWLYWPVHLHETNPSVNFKDMWLVALPLRVSRQVRNI